MTRLSLEGWISRSNSNGGVSYCPGDRIVVLDVIPSDAPQDWDFGPKQKPGKVGAYLEHLFYPAQHGPYAFTVADTEESAQGAAGSFFRAKNWEQWPRKET